MPLKLSYTLLAPVYDMAVSGPLDKVRQRSLQRIDNIETKNVLINGVGTGLDIPYLIPGAHYTATDITPAMLNRARDRASHHNLDIEFLCADSQSLPFDDHQFDVIIMHLILAVVPNPVRALSEACRVLKPGGRMHILDKFLRPGELALMRRLLNLASRHVATRMDVVFEDVLAHCDELVSVSDEPALAGGWFRLIELSRKSS